MARASKHRHRAGLQDRTVALGADLPAIPERLLLAHARGEVLFVAGAGISQPSNLPRFKGLVLKVYAKLDSAVHNVIKNIPSNACNLWECNVSGLTNQQAAEVKRFIAGEYDVVLGMLERRIDGSHSESSAIRQAIASELLPQGVKPAPIHRALMKLADRGGAVTIATTNFDLLLEEAAKRFKPAVQTYALGAIPRPGRRDDFAGVLHIHGAITKDKDRHTDLIVTDQDFGEFYLRRRIVPDFIYDAARLFHLVLIGYSANDPPMRYLLNAVAADGSRFDDLKERYTFVGMPSEDPISIEDWKGRGITPISYSSNNDHSILTQTFERWAQLSAINGNKRHVDAAVKRIVKNDRNDASDADKDLFDHLFRRADTNERGRLAELASASGASMDWLDSMSSIFAERDQERR